MLWPEAWHGLRDRLLGSARFQTWAAAFPLTRPIARSRARASFDLCAGFVYSQILLACVRLRILEQLLAGAAPLSRLARDSAVPVPAMLLLLEAAATLDLVQRRGSQTPEARFGLGSQGAALLANPAVLAMVEHHALLYADLADPLVLLRGTAGVTQLQQFWCYTCRTDMAPDDAAVSSYSQLMSRSQPLVSGAILAACDLRQFHCLLDIGGGDGSFLLTAVEHAPRLRGILFDLPPVSARAAVRFAGSSARDRLQTAPGDFRKDALPAGADLVTLVRVLHDHDDDTALALLRAIHGVMRPSGTLLIAEPLRATPGAERMGDAYFGFYLLAMGQGRSRSFEEVAALLNAAGFDEPRERATPVPLQTRVLLTQAKRVNST